MNVEKKRIYWLWYLRVGAEGLLMGMTGSKAAEEMAHVLSVSVSFLGVGLPFLCQTDFPHMVEDVIMANVCFTSVWLYS
jgi:hypothetical protein